jgi:hypothetical protein
MKKRTVLIIFLLLQILATLTILTVSFDYKELYGLLIVAIPILSVIILCKKN